MDLLVKKESGVWINVLALLLNKDVRQAVIEEMTSVVADAFGEIGFLLATNLRE